MIDAETAKNKPSASQAKTVRVDFLSREYVDIQEAVVADDIKSVRAFVRLAVLARADRIIRREARKRNRELAAKRRARNVK